jgi:NADH dehydrogenase
MTVHVVTGAYGFSGRAIAARLLDRGHTVRTLTNSPDRPHPFGDRIRVYPMDFTDPRALESALDGADVLHNTYWVRFNHQSFGHASAVKNTRRLFEAAKRSGIRRLVHTSITNPSIDSPLEYFRGKAELERALTESGLGHSILRPAVLFGPGGILVNNIAWALRRLPVFGVFGDGSYRLQPIHVDDFADLAVEHAERNDDVVVDAIGPETFTFRSLVETIGRATGRPRRIISVSPRVGFLVASLIGWATNDVFLTRAEIDGLMQNLLWTTSEPTGSVRLTDWVSDNADRLGRSYASELGRRRDRSCSYDMN